MSILTNRPEILWTPYSLSLSVEAYEEAFQGEFWWDPWKKSRYPYKGPAKAKLQRLTNVIDESDDRFEGRGNGCWAIKGEYVLHELTANLFAAADALGGVLESESSTAGPGPLGADGGTVWVSLLDGGVGVSVWMWQDEETNHMRANQMTTIRGPRAYRVLLEPLGFDWNSRKLFGEKTPPTHVEIADLVDELLIKAKASADTGHF